jgi:hypothetical protein
MGTDQLDSMIIDLNREDKAFENVFKESIKSSKLILSTPIPVQPNEEGVYEWCRFIQLDFDPDCVEKERSITVNLFRTKKKKDKWEQLGRSNSFFIVHLSGQELKEMVLDFRDSYDSKSEGKVKLRLQYVHDQRQLFSDLVQAYEEHKALIEIWIVILEEQRENYISRLANDIKDNNDIAREDCASHNAGFYSIWENDSILSPSPKVIDENIHFTDKNTFMESLGSYDVTHDFAFGRKQEEDEFENVVFSQQQAW